jgi:Rod binding domain-containing protein
MASASKDASLPASEDMDLGEGSFGRRYRPLENGKMANLRLKAAELDEPTRLAKLGQIRKSAEEYEGMLITEMIKSMRQSPFVKTPGSDTYSEIAEKPFTAALTAAGGLGLAQTIVTQVAAQEGLGETLAAHPEVMGPHYRQRLAPSQMTRPGPRAAAGKPADADAAASQGAAETTGAAAASTEAAGNSDAAEIAQSEAAATHAAIAAEAAALGAADSANAASQQTSG